jgi:hypothetical protein
MVSTTERSAGAGAFAAVCVVGCAGELVALRAGTSGSWALAGLDAGVEDGPATGDEELDAWTCVSFVAGTLSSRGAFACGGDAAVVEVDACGGE